MLPDIVQWPSPMHIIKLENGYQSQTQGFDSTRDVSKRKQDSNDNKVRENLRKEQS